MHGDLVVIDRSRADDWGRIERGLAPGLGDTLAQGVVSTLERGAGTTLLLHTPDGPSVTGIAPTDDGVLIVTHLGDGGPAVLEAARSLPDDAYESTNATLTFGIDGGLVFDGTASAAMATDAMMALEIPVGGELAVEVAAHAEAGGHSLHVIRLRRV